ncbi:MULTISPECIES: helix-turn-helix domain-containing protein [Streptomyces]|uniref:helix-turn-helix domain-containing protein n=1 Tax=Streptomyces TaxID=1883 RepID=UPI000B0EE4D5|nr:MULTISPECIES: helix-turn-helix domain-containing protein [Streptomyces]MDX2516731.1 helix-turn-helix domain-containing protein [Streptomyces stelliscabiei]
MTGSWLSGAAWHAARGRSNARIARETGLDLDTVRCWRGRFVEHGPAGLSDRERSGRPVVHRVAGGPGQGPGLPAASRERRAAGALVVPGTGP